MKKGFTLIELLAVIVILAIIALIATPIILGIIEDARIGSIEASANGYIDAVEYQIARNEIKGETISDGTYDVHQLEIDLDGEKPTYGEVTIEKGKVSKVSLCIDGKKVELNNNTPKVIGTCASLYNEELLNGADPVLKGELIPVNITSNGVVTKADLTKEWYNYSNKKWANAVILFDNESYKVGEEIPESNIKEYYVWIPRYAYKLWNVNSDNLDNVEQPIEIVFGSKASTTGENNGDMYLHPAFTNFNTQGIWVGKFELSYNEETYTDSNTFLIKNPNVDNNIINDSKKVIIKPNVRSLINKTPIEFYTLLKTTHEDLNSHMMTNMEWGAVGYLTYSIYGRCTSDSCIELTNNNINVGWYGSSELYPGQWEYGPSITGCAANNIGDEINSLRTLDNINRYNSEKGVLASTTGNITGIYDMSGGNWEFVMGALIETKGLELLDLKYYNAYKNNYEVDTDNWYDYKEGMLGDATKEIANTKTDSSIKQGNWFNDLAYFATSAHPWFVRGGGWNLAKYAGVFNFSRFYDTFYTYVSARSVLAF